MCSYNVNEKDVAHSTPGPPFICPNIDLLLLLLSLSDALQRLIGMINPL